MEQLYPQVLITLLVLLVVPTLTDSSSSTAGLTMNNNDTLVDISGTLSNGDAGVMTFTCGGTATTGASSSNNGATSAGIILRDGASVSNASGGGGFQFNLNGTGTCLTVCGTTDFNANSASISVDSTASGTVLYIDSGGSLTLGSTTLG